MRMFFMLMIMMMSSAFAMAQETYGIKIAGEDITGYNRYDLTEIPGVSGKVSFDPNLRTLTLDNATIEADGSYAILNETCDYLLIELIGTNTINVTNSVGIKLKEETTIWSNSGGKLSVKSDGCALFFEGCPLEIKNCWLEAEGAWGISANDNVAEEVLTIRNSHVEAMGYTGSICDIAGLKLEGCSITQPTGAAFDANVHAVLLNGKKVTDKVVIEDSGFGFMVAGVDVTSLNCKDLSVIDGVSGKVSFDPNTRTLTLENATIEAEESAIYNESCTALAIEVIGTCQVSSARNAVIKVKRPTIIFGSLGGASLFVKAEQTAGIIMDNAPLAINNCMVDVNAEDWGITGYGEDIEMLIIRDSDVRVDISRSDNPYGAIADIGGLELNGCSITQPSGAAFDKTLKGVALNGEVVKDKVVIEPDATGINDITVDVPARKQGIFTVEGVKLTQQWENLPAGIYIVNGKKCIKR